MPRSLWGNLNQPELSMKTQRYLKCAIILLALLMLTGIAAGQSPDSKDPPSWVYVGPFNRDTGFSWRSILGVDSNEVIENSIIITLMAIITIATLRTNYRLKISQSELEKSNRQLKEALRELESKEEQIVKQERLRALGEMAGGVAHDFNNALQPIVLAAGVLNRKRTELTGDPQMQNYIQVIHMASREATSTVKRLVRFFRPGQDHDCSLMDVNKSINDVIELTRPKWKEEAQRNGVTIEVTTDLEPDCTVKGHLDEFREMLVNLVFNAVDAIEESGMIHFETRRESDSVLLKVSDTGVGMPPNVSAKCLEPFFTTKANRGTGLGLSIVYGAVRRLKGGIYINSEEAQGTTFTIRIPLAKPDSTSGSQPKEKGKLWRANDGTLKFLLAEDNTAVRSLLADEIRRQGHDVELAVSGNQAWGMYQEQEFDVVLTDQAMPGMSGVQLARLVKGRHIGKPIILLTGFGDMVNSEDIGELVDVVISKPVLAADVMRAVGEIMGRKV